MKINRKARKITAKIVRITVGNTLNFFCCGIIMIMVKLSISPNCQIEKKVWDDPGFAFGI